MTQKKVHNRKNSYLICLCCCLLLFAGAMIAYHDIQIAQGAGLYLAGKYGSSNRVPFDILMDFIGGLAILLCIFCPLLIVKNKTPETLLRFTTIFLAFVPLINPGDLVHIGSHLSNWQIREAFLSGNFFQELIISLSEPMKTLILEIPLLILMLMVNAGHGEHKIKAWQKIMFIFSAVCIILYLLFPGFQEYTVFLMHYALILVLFDETEFFLNQADIKQNKSFTGLSWIFFGICGLRGIFKMIDLLQNTHL